MRITNLTRGNVVASNASLANTFWSRLRGWMGKLRVMPEEGLVIYPCKGVHTWWMFFPIDVLFVSPSGRILYIVENLRPFRFSRVLKEACLVVEMPGGAVQECGAMLGDLIEIEGWSIPGA